MNHSRRSQEERSASTRLLLLDATVTCLVERGYSGTTLAAVAEQAGVSRGAQLHHYGTRDRLVTAAVEHLAQRRLDEVRAKVVGLADDVDRPRQALDLLAGALSGPLYAATLELWVAARSDTMLREALLPVEQRVTAALTGLCRRYIVDDALLAQLTLDVVLGRGVGGLLVPFSPTRQRKALDAWASLLAARLAAHR